MRKNITQNKPNKKNQTIAHTVNVQAQTKLPSIESHGFHISVPIPSLVTAAIDDCAGRRVEIPAGQLRITLLVVLGTIRSLRLLQRQTHNPRNWSNGRHGHGPEKVGVGADSFKGNNGNSARRHKYRHIGSINTSVVWQLVLSQYNGCQKGEQPQHHVRKLSRGREQIVRDDVPQN
jgi:hypothetical protein